MKGADTPPRVFVRYFDIFEFLSPLLLTLTGNNVEAHLETIRTYAMYLFSKNS